MDKISHQTRHNEKNYIENMSKFCLMQQTQNASLSEKYTKQFLMIFESGNSKLFVSFSLIQKTQNGFVAHEEMQCAVPNTQNTPKNVTSGSQHYHTRPPIKV